MAKIPTYIKIFHSLSDGNWHKKSEFCRPYSQDDRRLREMKEKGWIDYEDRIIRQDGEIIYTEYRLTKINNDKWWPYYKRYNAIMREPNGQMSMVV